MKKINKELKKLIDFFKLTGYYDEKMFCYLLDHMIIDNDVTNKYDNYGIKKFFKNNKLINFNLFVPKIKNVNTMLVNIYVFAHAIKNYNDLRKEIKQSNTSEILPVSLVRIYAQLYLKRNNQMQIKEFEYKNYFSNKKDELLIAYNYSAKVADDFFKVGKILIPNEFYIDKEKAESSLYINLYDDVSIKKLK